MKSSTRNSLIPVVVLAILLTGLLKPVSGKEIYKSETSFKTIDFPSCFTLTLNPENHSYINLDKLLLESLDTSVKKTRTKEKHFNRAFWGSFILMMGSSIHYWIKYTRWIEDWQYKLTWEDQKVRFFTLKANRFDSNCFGTNTLAHAAQSIVFYNFARVTGHTFGEAFLFSLTTSLFWEYITEWREVVSVNDNMVSIFGGLPAGEAMFQSGRYLCQQGGIVNTILAYLVNPVQGLNNLIFPHNTQKDRLPYRKDEITLFVGGGSHRQGTDSDWFQAMDAGLVFNLRNIPPGKEDKDFSGRVKDTLATAIFARFSLGGEGIDEYEIEAKTLFYGFLSQKFQDTAEKKGHRLLWGMGSALHFLKKHSLVDYDTCQNVLATNRKDTPTPTQFTDKFMVLDLIGPMVDFTLYRGDLNLRFKGDLFLDFAQINSLALSDYSAIHDISRAKTLLLDWGYYPALGYSLSLRGDLTWRRFSLGAYLKYQYYDSIEGLDRFQDEMEIDDFNLVDSRFLYRFYFSYQIPRTRMGVRLTFEEVNRKGSIREVTSRHKDKRLYYQLFFAF